MKKKRLIDNFILMYLGVGILMFSITTIIGSILIERYLIKNIAINLNLEALSLGENENLIQYILNDETDRAEEDLRTISNYENAIIWIIDPQCKLLVSTDSDYSQTLPIDFVPSSWAQSDYQIGYFYDTFKDKRMSVVDKIKISDEEDGFIVIHYLMAKMYERRSGALVILQILFVLLYLSTTPLIILSYFRVHKPLMQITKGAQEYANGNLFYKIPVMHDDELGYLANTMNFMSDQLNQNSTYQRQFIANVSHDFRSPLTSIRGYAEAMQDGTIPPEFYGRYLGIIVSETQRLEKLTQSIKALNELDIKKQALNLELFELKEVIRSCAATFEGICNQRHNYLRLELPEDALTTYADKEQIRQVIYNLIDNAIKFSPNDYDVVVSAYKKNGRIFVSVKDFGIGIPKEEIPKIWNRFYKSDSSRGRDRSGTGLGLSIVKEIIHAHDQHIDVISTEGEGTEFIFTLEKRP